MPVLAMLAEGEAASVSQAVIDGFKTGLTSIQGDITSFMTAAIPVGVAILGGFIVFKFAKKFTKTVTN